MSPSEHGGSRRNSSNFYFHHIACNEGMHGKIVKYEIHLEQKMITIRVHTVSEGIASAHHITDIPATVFPWQ